MLSEDGAREPRAFTTPLSKSTFSTYTKKELNIVLQIEGLKSEKRMIQATDRKILDVQRQTKIDQEVSELEKELAKF